MKKLTFVGLGIACIIAASPALASEVVLRETACRLFDSRNIGGAGLGPKISTATLETRGDAGSTQGGQSDCGVPDTATGVVVNIVAFDPLAPGWGRLWPYGASEPLSTNINSTGALNESTGILATLGTDGKLSWHSSFTGHLVVDLAGWTCAGGDAACQTIPAVTALAWGTVEEKNLALPLVGDPSYDLTLDSGVHVVCATPYTSYEECDVAVGATVRASGHVLNLFGVQYLYAHGDVGSTP